MNMLKTLAVALALTLPAAALATSGVKAPIDATAALERINAAGQYSPHELEYRYGHWTAEGISTAGVKVDLLVDSDSGQVYAFDGHGSGAIPAQQVHQLVLDAGYVRVQEIEFDDGFWEAEAFDAQGRKSELVLHPVSGAILNQPAAQGPGSTAPLSREQVLAALTQAGYRDIRELDYDDEGHWDAEASNARGERVDLQIDPHSGAVLHEELED